MSKKKWNPPPTEGFVCECGEKPAFDGNLEKVSRWRWLDGHWQHFHGYPIGHVDVYRQEPHEELVEKTTRLFHETYETLAPKFGYKTRKKSAVDWDEVPEKNKALMLETVGIVIRSLLQLRQPQPDEGAFPYKLCRECSYKKYYDAKLGEKP